MLDPDLIAATLAELGEPAYRGRQVYEALTRGLVTDFGAVTTLPLALREKLAARLAPLSLTEVETQAAPQGAASPVRAGGVAPESGRQCQTQTAFAQSWPA